MRHHPWCGNATYGLGWGIGGNSDGGDNTKDDGNGNVTAAAEMLAANVALTMKVTAVVMTTMTVVTTAGAVAVAANSAVGVIKMCALKPVLFFASCAVPTTHAMVEEHPNQAHTPSPMVWGCCLPMGWAAGLGRPCITDNGRSHSGRSPWLPPVFAK